MERIRKLLGLSSGRGVNHEDQSFRSEATIDEILDGRGVQISLRVEGEDGTLFHEEETLILPLPEGGLSAWSFSINAPPVVSVPGGVTPACGAGCSNMELITGGGVPAAGNSFFGFEMLNTPDAGTALCILGLGSPSAFPWPPMGILQVPFTPFTPVLLPPKVVNGTSGCSGSAWFPRKLKSGWSGIEITAQGVFICPSSTMVLTNAVNFTVL